MSRATALRKGAEFDQVYTTGTVLRGPFFVLRYRRNTVPQARWGYAVGKRIAKSAVVRNRTRRRFREAVRRAAPPPGYDYIVTARASALIAPFSELADAFTVILGRIPPGNAP